MPRLRRVLLTPLNLSRDWPGLILGLLAVVGGIAGAVFGGFGYAVGWAVVTPMLGILVVGPAWLIQQRVRRRRGTAPSGGLLTRDADEVMTALAMAELRLIQRHRVAAYVLTIVVFGGGFVFIWRMSSLTLAIILVGVPIAWGLFAAVVTAVRRK